MKEQNNSFKSKDTKDRLSEISFNTGPVVPAKKARIAKNFSILEKLGLISAIAFGSLIIIKFTGPIFLQTVVNVGAEFDIEEGSIRASFEDVWDSFRNVFGNPDFLPASITAGGIDAFSAKTLDNPLGNGYKYALANFGTNWVSYKDFQGSTHFIKIPNEACSSLNMNRLKILISTSDNWLYDELSKTGYLIKTLEK